MRIRLLGTGTPTPSLKRMCSGYVVEIGSRHSGFDASFDEAYGLSEYPSSRGHQLDLALRL